MQTESEVLIKLEKGPVEEKVAMITRKLRSDWDER